VLSTTRLTTIIQKNLIAFFDLLLIIFLRQAHFVKSMIPKSNKKRKTSAKEDIIFWVVLFLLVAFFAGALIYSNVKMGRKRDELNQKIDDLKAQIQTLEEEKEKFETGISETQKDVYWEEKARGQGYVKEGENAVVVIPPPENSAEQASIEKSFSEKLWDEIKSIWERMNPQ